MELSLNLEWMALAAAMYWLWMHHARREGRKRSAQFVSLALVLGIMFTVITMYDDMAMAQNPAETRSFQREDDIGAHAHAQVHLAVASTPTLATEPESSTFRFAVPGSLLVPAVKVPVLPPFKIAPLPQPEPFLSFDLTPGWSTSCS